jgi:hypothetical protein
MKKIIIILSLVVLPGFLLAQSTPFSDIYTTYVSEQGFETTEMMPGSTSFEWENNLDAQNIKDMIKDIESVRVLEYDGSGKISRDKLWKKLTSASQEGNYTEVMSMKGDEQEAALYMMKRSDGIYSEIALIAKEKDEIVMVTITGNIDFGKMFSPETMKSLRELGDYYMKGKGGCEVK